MNILSRFMNWARGGSSQPEQVVVPDTTAAEVAPMPDFDNFTKREIVEWVEEKYGDKLSMRKKKAELVKEAENLTLETSSNA